VLSIMSESFLLLAPIVGEESFGNVVLEARSAGLPAVTFARGGLPELVEDRKSGFVCRSADLQGLLAGIEFFLEDPASWAKAREFCLRSMTDSASPYSSAAFESAWRAVFSTESMEVAARGQTV
jgi:glycosyltransferase involved in cell wall biosynthesis